MQFKGSVPRMNVMDRYGGTMSASTSVPPIVQSSPMFVLAETDFRKCRSESGTESGRDTRLAIQAAPAKNDSVQIQIHNADSQALNGAGFQWFRLNEKKDPKVLFSSICKPWLKSANAMFGAGNETRTRDPDLGKVVLYQLSYSRILVTGAILTFQLAPSTLCFKNLFFICRGLQVRPCRSQVLHH